MCVMNDGVIGSVLWVTLIRKHMRDTAKCAMRQGHASGVAPQALQRLHNVHSPGQQSSGYQYVPRKLKE